MKLKIDWKALWRMRWDTVKPVLLAAIGANTQTTSADVKPDVDASVVPK